MKRIIAFVFLSILLLQSGGMIWWLKVRQFCVQYEVIEQLHKNELPSEILLLSPSEYADAAKDNGREIHWNGKLYDVISKTTEHGKLRLLVYNDTKEEQVLYLLAKFIKNSNRKQKEAPSMASQLLALIYLQPLGYTHTEVTSSTARVNSVYCFVSKTYRKEISSPPPKMFS